MLFVVSTPIGNLKDITFRAVETLQEVDFIICEDTRVTSFLLNHYNIKKELVSLNAASEVKKTEYITERIKRGEKAALVSDAGTPTISDPGIRLISALINIGVRICTIPGASALTAALSIAGLPTDSFVFEGFPPQKKGRQTFFRELSKEKRTVVLYESTYRIEKLLNDLVEFLPERYIVICRELTKMFEETIRGFPKDILERLDTLKLKGEFVIVISPINWEVR